VPKILAWLCALLWASAGCQAAALRADESRWLEAMWPVLRYAVDAGLPLDIVVQPQDTPGAPPLALAYIDERCKLVLSMRGNPDVKATLQRIEPELLGPTLELMAAHEIGHCQRHAAGAWGEPPADLARATGPDPQPLSDDEAADLQAVRREEGYADLVGLAWTLQQHAALYPRLQAWLVAERTLARAYGPAHDTLAWAALAADADRLQGRNVFDAAAALWHAGLVAEAGAVHAAAPQR
jgi:hypothetical protein